MTKLQRAALAAQETVESIAYGLAQMTTMTPMTPQDAEPRRSDANAIMSDWERLGRDLNRVAERAAGNGERR